jgi:hypothetical protein
MKTLGQVVDEIDRRVDLCTSNALNPDRDQWLRNRDLQRREELLSLRKFLTEEPA